MTKRRREAAINAALPDVLERVAGGLRAGVAPLGALTDATSAADLPDALAADLHLVIERAGEVGLAAALDRWSGERQLPSVAATAAALGVAMSAGGPAAPAIDGLAAGLRDRDDAAAEVAALSAQARLSAIVVGAAPFVSLALSLLVDPRVAPTLAGTAAGRSCLLVGIALEGAAALWMRQIVRCGVCTGAVRPRRRSGLPHRVITAVRNATSVPVARNRRSFTGMRRKRNAGSRTGWAGGCGLRPDTVALTADLLAMAVAAGLTPYLAVEVAVRSVPGPLAERLDGVLAATEGGLRFADALDAEAARCPALASTLALLAASERSGAPVGAALCRLAAVTRAQARRRAMARARTVPVRLLFPLVFLVLPAFLVLTVAPVVLASLTH